MNEDVYLFDEFNSSQKALREDTGRIRQTGMVRNYGIGGLSFTKSC